MLMMGIRLMSSGFDLGFVCFHRVRKVVMLYMMKECDASIKMTRIQSNVAFPIITFSFLFPF
jgi:hypothetical protein